MDRFEEILTELGHLIALGILIRRGVCQLNINDVFHVQIEFQPQKERLLLVCMISEVPPGKFRENILKDGLRANWPRPLHGTLCYCEKNNNLCLFEARSLENITGQKLLDTLHAFIAKADSWRVGVEMGQTGTLIPSVKRKNREFLVFSNSLDLGGRPLWKSLNNTSSDR